MEEHSSDSLTHSGDSGGRTGGGTSASTALREEDTQSTTNEGRETLSDDVTQIGRRQSQVPGIVLGRRPTAHHSLFAMPVGSMWVGASNARNAVHSHETPEERETRQSKEASESRALHRQRARKERDELPQMVHEQRHIMAESARESVEEEEEKRVDRMSCILGALREIGKGLAEFVWVLLPPIPAYAVPKMAFRAPPPSYYIEYEQGGRLTRCPRRPLVFSGDRMHFNLTNVNAEPPMHCEVTWTKTTRGNWVCWAMVQPESRVEQGRTDDWGAHVIIYSHPNATDMGYHMFCWPNAESIANYFDSTVVVYDYSGYGLSSGRPSEADLYADIRAVYDAVLVRCTGVSPSSIVLWGQSLGTAASIHLAAELRVDQLGGVICAAAFMSALRIYVSKKDANENVEKKLPCDQLCSIHKIGSIAVPVLLMHGVDDRMISWHHSRRLHMRCRRPVPPLYIKGVGHNDIDMSQDYWRRVKHFLKCELPMHRPPQPPIVSPTEEEKQQ